jgi:hypothetical protein
METDGALHTHSWRNSRNEKDTHASQRMEEGLTTVLVIGFTNRDFSTREECLL